MNFDFIVDRQKKQREMGDDLLNTMSTNEIDTVTLIALI